MTLKNIFITGSNGFIGKNLKEFLSVKYNLLTPNSKELNLLDETKVKKYFKDNKIDFVIHCASRGGARGIVDSDNVVTDNLKMFDNLSNNITDQRMIFFGSGA